VISREHYDHCDLDAFRRYPGEDAPLVVAGPAGELARKAGFSNVRALEPWQSARAGDLTVSAAPGKHGVYEVGRLGPNRQVSTQGGDHRAN
jgi:L-ascorbate metabolism protein UlaG (beta-lactamase superfamily)